LNTWLDLACYSGNNITIGRINIALYLLHKGENLVLTSEQIAQFDTFGFILMRGLFSQGEMKSIEDGFETIMVQDRGRKEYRGERQSLEPFAEKEPILTSLADDDRIYKPIEQLLGSGFVWEGSDGNHYTGDTLWHPDKGGEAVRLGYRQIKVIFYLDKLSKDDGCLRVIPGSHKEPLHSSLLSLQNRDNDNFGVSQSEIPGYPLETSPGDVIFFHQSLFHASFNGGEGRRMFTFVFAERPETKEQISYVSGFSVSFKPRRVLVDSDRPRIRQMMEPLVEIGLEVVGP